jgi:hypothetical protein
MGDFPIPLASRTVEGIQRLAEVICQIPGAFTVYRDALTEAASRIFKDLASHPVRGTINPGGQVLSFQHLTSPKHPPVWFVFSGTPDHPLSYTSHADRYVFQICKNGWIS